MRALISVSDKTGIVTFAHKLTELGYEIISTGGTYKVLKDNNIKVTPIEDVTEYPEMLDGRVKTLHPKIHGGLLALRDKKSHVKACEEHHIKFIDLVVVNLYPFEKTISKEDVTLSEAIENIDIGGPSMLRSASKNYKSVGVIVDPERYDAIISELEKGKGKLKDSTKAMLAHEAFQHTARYDSLIAGYFADHVCKKEKGLDSTITPILQKISDLRYGENPHQKAAFYKVVGESGLAEMKQLHGKELSYNNIVDIEAAWHLVRELELPGAVVIKHTNPCGAAIAENVTEAYKKAYESDPISAFGSIVGLNRTVDVQTAEEIAKTFVEAVVAVGFDSKALKILQKKPSIRLIELPSFDDTVEPVRLRHVTGGFLIQTPDNKGMAPYDLKYVTEKKPNSKMQNDLLFAFTLVKHVKSNAIVVVKDGQLLGAGAGQMSRVDSMHIALDKAKKGAKGAVIASDAFFPFPDSIELAAKAGISAIIQPGGSKRDKEVIDCCDANEICMITTGIRHFKH
jgi:phosphoribosylaminoimidazolecarboxamide formyltransferase / IMP cyclohydrolase